MAKKRVVMQTIVQEPVDIFGGLGDFVPVHIDDGHIRLQTVEVKPLTKIQKKKMIERLIDKLDPPRQVLIAQKPKPVKRAPKKKKLPPPKREKKIDLVMLKSPKGNEQPIPLADIGEIDELLVQGWVIVGDTKTVSKARKVLNLNSKELQRA